MSHPAYLSWEKGKRKPGFDTIEKFYNFFGVSANYLLGNTNNRVVEEDELAEVSMLFRVAPLDMTDEEKAIFKQELLEFMRERQKLFDEDEIMNFINRFKINKKYNSFKKDIEEQLKDIDKISKFNPSPFMDGYDHQLENYMYEEILYCFIRAAHSNDTDERRFHSNVLIRLLGSFIDLYAQILNSFYDLELIPLRKNISPAYAAFGRNGIVSQAIKGVDNLSGSKAVTIEEVCRKLKSEYTSNEYFDKIDELIQSEKMKSLKILRNYVTHYQSVFSKYSHSYMPNGDGSSIKTFNVSGSKVHKEEHEIFISLMTEIIKFEVDLIFNFKLMYYDKKMVKKVESIKTLYVLECPKCKQPLQVTEQLKIVYDKNLKIKLKHGDCSSDEYLNLTDEKFEAHPERYDQLLNHELSIFNGDGEKIL